MKIFNKLNLLKIMLRIEFLFLLLQYRQVVTLVPHKFVV